MFQRSLRPFSNRQTQKNFDVVVSGGGMIGSTVALALSKNPALHGYRIALIEASPKKSISPKTASSAYSNRVSAINPSSRDLFKKLGVWERLSRYRDVRSMKVWGAYTEDTIDYKSDSGLEKNVAYIIENDEIVDAVIQELTSRDNVTILYGSKITGVEKCDSNKSETLITLNNGDSCRVRLLVGADGANSEVRKFMEVQYLSYSYDQTAVVATLSIIEQENLTAWQRFLPTGPIALLPLSDTFSSLVWSTTHENAKNLLTLPPPIFAEAVNDAFTSSPVKDDVVALLKNIVPTFVKHSSTVNEFPSVCGVVESSRAAFPLGFGHAVDYVKPGVALVGDSAHKVHPLAGQGVNLGFRDVHNLSTALSLGLTSGRELGDYVVLKKYQQMSQLANLPIMLAIDMIHRVYSSDIGVVRAMGSLGIHLTETVSPIKSIMKKVAST